MLSFELLLFCFPGGRRKKKESCNWDLSGGGHICLLLVVNRTLFETFLFTPGNTDIQSR